MDKGLVQTYADVNGRIRVALVRSDATVLFKSKRSQRPKCSIYHGLVLRGHLADHTSLSSLATVFATELQLMASSSKVLDPATLCGHSNEGRDGHSQMQLGPLLKVTEIRNLTS